VAADRDWGGASARAETPGSSSPTVLVSSPAVPVDGRADLKSFTGEKLDILNAAVAAREVPTSIG
jgi:hypothetical protein